MDLGEALLIGSFTTPIWFILMQKLSLSNWFKKQQFKYQMETVKKQNQLKLKQLEKQMGLKSSPTKDKNDTISQLLPYLPQLLELAKDNPELVDMLGGFMEGGGEEMLGGLPVGDLLTTFASGMKENATEEKYVPIEQR